MTTQVQISFPGLGIDTFTVNKVAFEVFGIDVRWYGVMIVLGMIMAFGYAILRSKQEGFTWDDVIDMGLYIVLFGVLGARLYYVIMRWDTFWITGRSFFDNLGAIFNIRGGGLAIYGGVIAGALTIILYSKIKKKPWLAALDMIAPGVMLAQAMGRWGNFFNGEAHGGIVEADHALYFLRMGLQPNELLPGQMAYVHPTFLYESLWNLVGFALINLLIYPRKKFNGQIAMTYFAWYGFGRMLIEGLRTDSLYLGNSGIRVSQLVGALCFVVFTTLIVFMLFKTHRLAREEAGDTYIPVYSNVAPTDVKEESAAEDTKSTEDVENAEDAEKLPADNEDHGGASTPDEKRENQE